MSYGSRANLTMGRNLKQTVYTHVDTAQSPMHLADHLAQHGKTSAEDVENWDTGSPSAEAIIKEHRTRDIPTREKGENPRKSVKLELMTTTDQVGVATVLQAPSHSDPNTIHISEV